MSSLCRECRSSLWFDRLDDNIYLACLLVCIQQTQKRFKQEGSIFLQTRTNKGKALDSHNLKDLPQKIFINQKFKQ